MGLRHFFLLLGDFGMFTHPAGGDGIETMCQDPRESTSFTHPAGGDGIETSVNDTPTARPYAFTHPAGGDGIETFSAGSPSTASRSPTPPVGMGLRQEKAVQVVHLLRSPTPPVGMGLRLRSMRRRRCDIRVHPPRRWGWD